jgi:hypothetical protein
MYYKAEWVQVGKFEMLTDTATHTHTHTHTHIYTRSGLCKKTGYMIGSLKFTRTKQTGGGGGGERPMWNVHARTRVFKKTWEMLKQKQAHTHTHLRPRRQGNCGQFKCLLIHFLTYARLLTVWGLSWKQEAEAGRMLYTGSLKLISLNKNVSCYWLNKHIFCGRCQAAAIYDTIIWRITSEPNREFNMSQMCEQNSAFFYLGRWICLCLMYSSQVITNYQNTLNMLQ